MKVFLSYNRADAAAAASIASDLEGLGHDVWYDTEISGGQSWWDAILGQIRASDLFILLMTTKSLNSEACRAEYRTPLRCRSAFCRCFAAPMCGSTCCRRS